MSSKSKKILFLIISLGLCVGGIVCLCIAIFGRDKDNWWLCAALACTALGNCFNAIQLHKNKKK